MKKFINKIKKTCKDFMTGKSGFSLVELIVVIAIMAVMAAVLAPALLGYVERSRAQKDDSAMGEVTNAIQLSLADQNIYDELLPYTVKGNFSCYADGDTSTNTDANKIITKSPDYWLFNDNARLLDETAYQPAGSMRGVTITLKPNGSAEYVLKDGIINQTGDSSTAKGTITGKTLNDAPEVYNRLRSTVGDAIKVSSQTYRNSTYTIFISMGTTGGNQADAQDAIQVYGQYNGTNLPEVMTATGSATQDKGNAGSGSNGGSGQPSEPVIVGSATFSAQTGNNCDGSNDEDGLCFDGIHDCWVPIEPVTLTWDELKLAENGTRYGYDASKINDTSIGNFAFPNSSLTSITIPDGVTSIGDWVFYECYGLTSITIPDSVTSIGDYAFGWCDRITSITIPDSVISIGDRAFQDCASLTSITIPDSVTSIGDDAFNYCTNLTSITLGNSVTSIGDMQFSGCLSLISVTIGNSVTSIGDDAFNYCTNLTSITIPDSVTSIGDDAFIGCTSLTDITFEGTKAQWNAISRGEWWNDLVPATVVHCADGDVAI